MDFQTLASRLQGAILTPNSSGYEEARRIWNGMIDRKPAAIVRCSGPEDVIEAVRFAVANDLFPAVRAGGHNVAGTAMVDGGLVIDVSAMKQYEVNVQDRTIMAQAGLNWGEFDKATAAHGLATTGGLISTTGIAGLTLGGGIGWLMGRFGLVCDNTLGYDIVTADGQLIRASANEHQDLFWALKGGGGNFGVVTSITYRLYPITTVISGMLLYPLSEGRQVLKRFRDFVSSGLPDELIVYAAAIHTPDGMPCVVIIPAYSGDDLAKGAAAIAPLKQFGTLLADLTGPMPYVQMQQMLDAGAPYGIRSYWKSNFLAALPDEAIDTFVDFAERCPSPQTFAILEHSHGAAARVPLESTAFPVRHEGLDMVVLSLWPEADQDAANIAWTRGLYEAMLPWSAGVAYVNGLSEDDGDRVSQAFGSNFTRLCKVKGQYDPQNRFRRNQNIQPLVSRSTVLA